MAGIAAGADGIMIEVHTNPERAMSDGNQSLKPEKFKDLMEKVKKVAVAVGRSV
jgi:3-deoxy-7-phosphoheptulonate synthase